MAKAAAEADAAETRGQRPFYWWHVTDLKENGLVDALIDAGPNARLEFREDTELFRVVDPDAVVAQTHDGDGEYDHVHKCPPTCP